jgi:hypothetical protein
VNPNSGFRRQLEQFERQLQERNAKDGDGDDGDEVKLEKTKVGRDEVEYTQPPSAAPWMKAEIVRWHARDQRLEVVQEHEGDWLERARGWGTNVGTQLWAYNFRRFGKKLQRFVRSARQPAERKLD